MSKFFPVSLDLQQEYYLEGFCICATGSRFWFVVCLSLFQNSDLKTSLSRFPEPGDELQSDGI
jgi:hypothetical protein